MLNMKKYLLLSFLFLFIACPAYSKVSAETKNRQGQNSVPASKSITVSPSPKNTTITPTNTQTQTQNQGENQNSSVKTQESEQLNQEVNQSIVKVSDQVHELINTVGAKGGIGEQVREIAQNQVKLQEEVKTDFEKLNGRGKLVKLLIGSDKKITTSLENKIEQNTLMIQRLEELKLQTKNASDIQQIQETIEMLTYQNTSLQNKVNQEKETHGIFGWLVNLLDQKSE
jgi:hypothetical protein